MKLMVLTFGSVTICHQGKMKNVSFRSGLIIQRTPCDGKKMLSIPIHLGSKIFVQDFSQEKCPVSWHLVVLV